MTRLFKKIYIFVIFLFGISFWALLVKNSSVADVPLKDKLDSVSVQHRSNQISHKELIFSHLRNLEGEIASQKEASNQLLTKLKTKYSNFIEPGHPNGEQASVIIKLNSRETLKKDKEKLAALQKYLLQEAHQGEVRSDIVDLTSGENPDKDTSHKNNHVNSNRLQNSVQRGKNRHRPKDEEDLGNGEVVDVDPLVNTKTQVFENENVIAILVFVCDRPSVKKNLDQLFKYRPSAKKFPIIVSQDCGAHPATTTILNSYGDQFLHIMQPDLREVDVPPKEKKLKGYYKISRHYGWALNYTFEVLNYANVIIVEDDLDIAPDFFEYFSATLPIMRKDPSIWCVSAWNDNGKPKRINETAFDLLHRTDFFPGLGWMLTKEIWSELMVKWPRGYWDDWMREPAQRKDRVCIRPEISRTHTFGKDGVSQGTYYMNHLRFIKLNDHFVPFTSLDLSYLLKDYYDVEFVRKVYSSELINSVKELTEITANSTSLLEYRLMYRSEVDFRKSAKKLELMEDFRAGVPRTAYRGVVPFILNGHRCYLAPSANWVSYQPFKSKSVAG